MFGFIKKAFVVAINFFSFNALKSVLINNQEYKIRPRWILTVIFFSFILIVLKKISAVVVVIISMTHIQNVAFLMLLKHKHQNV